MMKPERGKLIALVSLTLALSVGVGSLIASKRLLLEEWRLHCLESEHETVRNAAAERLVQMRSAKVVPYLLGILKASDHGKQITAIQGLERIGPDAKAAARTLCKLFLTVDPATGGFVDYAAPGTPLPSPPATEGDQLRAAAADALVSLGPQVLPVLLDEFVGAPGHPNALGQRTAALLKRWGSESIPLLMQELKDRHEHFRTSLASLLGSIGSAAVPALLEALRNGDRSFRLWGIYALGTMGLEAEAAVPSLLATLEDEAEDRSVRFEALRALDALRETRRIDKKMIPLAIDFLRNQPESRQVAADALASMGPQAVPALLDLLREKDGGVPLWARSILWHLGAKHEEAHSLLVKALEDHDPSFHDRVRNLLDLIEH